MLEAFTVATFTPLVGEVFRLDPGDGSQMTDLRLAEATSSAPGATREQFSLVFRGPPGVVLPQQIYPLEHDGLGAFELFLVPIGADAAGVTYEAVFT